MGCGGGEVEVEMSCKGLRLFCKAYHRIAFVIAHKKRSRMKDDAIWASSRRTQNDFEG